MTQQPQIERPVENASGRIPPTEPGASTVTMRRRELFWQNVLQEMLTGLSAAAAQHGQSEMFDGRIAVVTRLGQRVPIASIFPLFACSVPGVRGKSRFLSEEVQCTVYQIRTPNGEVYTIPLHEISTLHALSPELIERLQRQSELGGRSPAGAGGPARRPFGFAAFTSLAHSEGEEDAV